MSTLAEIEAAVVKLPPAEMEHLANLLLALSARTRGQQRLQELYQRTGLSSFSVQRGRTRDD